MLLQCLDVVKLEMTIKGEIWKVLTNIQGVSKKQGNNHKKKSSCQTIFLKYRVFNYDVAGDY